MQLVIAGIDEAGYGPTLGPLVVGLSAFRVQDWASGESVPNLWKLLSRGVSRSPGRAGKPDSRGRVAVADSKELKLANSVQSTHPLVHLERGVLSFLRCAAKDECGEPSDDGQLFARLACEMPAHECYAGNGTPLPVANDAPSIGIAANILAKSLTQANVEIAALRCRVVSEADVNLAVREKGSKAEANSGAFGAHLRFVWDSFAPRTDDERLVIVCDRLGGRDSYAPMLAKEIPGASVTVIEQTEDKSRYTVSRDGRMANVAFMVGGESVHMPIALASMAAKFVRELAMARFNRYWSRVYAEVKGDNLRPTAGYALDARRWLADAEGMLSDSDRSQLVRIA